MDVFEFIEFADVIRYLQIYKFRPSASMQCELAVELGRIV